MCIENQSRIPTPLNLIILLRSDVRRLIMLKFVNSMV